MNNPKERPVIVWYDRRERMWIVTDTRQVDENVVDRHSSKDFALMRAGIYVHSQGLRFSDVEVQ